MDTVLQKTILYDKIRRQLVKSGYAKTNEEAGQIIKEQITPLTKDV